MNMRKTILFAAAALLLAACETQAPKASDLPLVPALENSAWEASEWISAADAPVATGEVYKSAPGSSWLLSTLTNGKKVKKATWMASGLGVFDLFVNGEIVGQEVLKPGFTHYAKTKYAFTYDITPVFKTRAGEQNQLSAQLTPGWWADKIVTPGGTDGFIGKKCAFRAVLELVYADGSKELFGTDTEHWTAGIAGPVKHAGIFDGEEYDARELPGFCTPEKLSTPEVNSEFQGEIFPTCGAEIYQREDLRLRPVSIYVWEGTSGAVASDVTEEVEYGVVNIKRTYRDGEVISLQPGETLVVDFGQNAAAVPSFSFQAPEGTLLECNPSEILNDGNGAERRGMDGPEGSTHRRNLRVDPGEIWLTYTFSDCAGQFVDYQPRASFWGYRYISVTADQPVQFASISSVPVTSISKDMETGTLITGNESVNKLISNTLWGQRSNYLSVPTDCPQRNERLGWTADTQVFTETGTFFANTSRFFHKWMRDMRDSQNEKGGFPGVAPFAQYGNEKMRLGWADAGVIVPWTVWKQFGDKAIVTENWKAMEKYMAHVNETKYDAVALKEENGNYNWADWLSYEALESCSGRAFQNAETRAQAGEYWNYLGACYWALDAGYMRDMAAAAGFDAAKYEAMEADAKAYLKERFLQADGRFVLDVLNTMQTPALFALKLNLVEGEARESMLSRLRKNFEDHGNCLQTGFLGTSILMQTLTENGMADMAYELLLQRKNPSWLYSVDSIAADPAVPGFRHIIMKPVPDKRLGHLEATYKSAAGTIKSAWKYEGDNCKWTFTIPRGATATVVLPSETKEYQAGTYTVEYK